MRPTQPLNRRRGRRIAAAAIGFALVAAACSDKKDDEAVGGADDTTATEETEAAAAPRRRRRLTPHPRPTARRRPRRAPMRPPTGPPRPRTAADGESEQVTLTRCRRRRWIRSTAGASSSPARPRSATPWTPADGAVRLVLPDAHPHVLRAAVHRRTRTSRCRATSPRASAQRGRHGVDDQGPRGHLVHRRHAAQRRRRRSTTSTARSAGILVAGALKDIAKNPDGTLVDREARRLHVHHRHRQERRPRPAGLVGRFPYYLTGQAGLHRLADVAGRRRRRPDAGDPAGRHRPVHRAGVPARRPHDRRPRTPTTGAPTPTATSCRTSTRSSSA